MIQHVRLEYKQIESRKHEHNCKTKYRLNKVDLKKINIIINKRS